MPTNNEANHRHKWGVVETEAKRQRRKRILAEYIRRRRVIESGSQDTEAGEDEQSSMVRKD